MEKDKKQRQQNETSRLKPQRDSIHLRRKWSQYTNWETKTCWVDHKNIIQKNMVHKKLASDTTVQEAESWRKEKMYCGLHE